MKTIIAAVVWSALAVGAGGLAIAAAAPGAGIIGGATAAARAANPVLIARGPDKNDPPEDKKHHKDKDGKENYGGPFFRPVDTGYFRQCYAGIDVNRLPPGLRKQAERTGHLPPGLEKHLERDGTLPPGLQKRMAPASPCVLGHLRRLPPRSRLYTLGRDAYLIDYHTHRILDVLRGAY